MLKWREYLFVTDDVGKKTKKAQPIILSIPNQKNNKWFTINKIADTSDLIKLLYNNGE